jgi:hypothetical protein
MKRISNRHTFVVKPKEHWQKAGIKRKELERLQARERKSPRGPKKK